MDVYVGHTGTGTHLDFMREHGLHRLISWSWCNPKGFQYALDNGAFASWRKKKPFDAERFIKLVKKADTHEYGPDFVVCPDIVAGGPKSLQFSREWFEKMPRDDYYLAVQDGMNVKEVLTFLKDNSGFKGIFVGGTLTWKLLTAERWVGVAHIKDLKCHIGRVGTFRRMLWAKRIGADSIDSSTFANRGDLSSFQRVIAMMKQTCFDNLPCTGEKGCICNGCAMPHLDASAFGSSDSEGEISAGDSQ